MIIKINKLFGQYSTEIDLNKRCTIYIGENGIGKSTTINIINCILEQDYYSILKYNFESFDVNYINVKYEELIPTKKELLDYFININCNNYPDLIEEELKKGIIYKTHEKTKNITKDFDNQPFNEYYDYLPSDGLSDLLDRLSDEEYKQLISTTVSKITTVNLRSIIDISLMETNFVFANNLEELISKITKAVKDIINNKEIPFYKSSKYTNLLFKEYNKSFSLSMVRDYQIINESNKYIYNSIDKKIYNKFQKNKEENNKTKSFLNYKTFSLLSEYQKEYKNSGKEKYIKECKNSFKNVKNYNVFEELSNKRKINITKMLTSMFYDSTYVEEFLSNYYDCIVNNEESFSNENLTDSLHNKYRKSLIDNYINPLIPKHSYFDNKHYYHFESALFKKFLEENDYLNISKIDNYQINILQKLLDKYFVSKNAKVTPSKIFITTKGLSSEEIDYEALSDGEKKLIILFVICVFYDDVTLFLDEPETSLSIIWQEQLIPDLLRYTKIKNIIIATQSPYIASDESLFDYIIPIIVGD